MTFIRTLCLIGGLILLGSIVWAVGVWEGGFIDAVGWLTSESWGVVTLIDLYLGFFFVAIFIWLLEPNRAIALLFILPLPFLGNVWAAAWMAWRLARAIRMHRSEGA